MPSLKDELLVDLSKTKEYLYPLISKSANLNESARNAEHLICQAWDCLEQAMEEIKARANDNIPSIQRRF
jgi:hypothetical protein